MLVEVTTHPHIYIQYMLLLTYHAYLAGRHCLTGAAGEVAQHLRDPRPQEYTQDS